MFYNLFLWQFRVRATNYLFEFLIYICSNFFFTSKLEVPRRHVETLMLLTEDLALAHRYISTNRKARLEVLSGRN